MQSNIGGVTLSCLCWLLLLLSPPFTDGGGLPKRWGSQRSSAGLRENSAQLRLLGALRGGQLDGAVEEEEEDDQRIEKVVVNQTEWLQAVGKPGMASGPGLMQMTWGVGSQEITSAKEEMRDALQEVLEASESDEEKETADSPARSRNTATGSRKPSKEEALFNEFLYGKGTGERDGGGKRGGDDVMAKGLARQMKKDRARERHLAMLEEDEKGGKTEEGPKPVRVTEEQLQRAWMGPGDNETVTEAERETEYTLEEEADARNRAERVLNTALSFQPDDKEAIYAKGLFLQNERGDVQGAEQAFREVLRRDPLHPMAASSLGYIEYAVKGDAASAERLLKVALQGNQACVPALCSYGALQMDVRDDINSAAELFQRAIDHQPSHVQSLRNLASAKARSGAPHSEVDSLHQRAVAADPRSPSIRCSRARDLARARKWSTAEEEYLKALSLDPSSVNAVRGYASLSRASGGRVGSRESLRKAYEAALASSPTNVGLIYGLGSVMLESIENGGEGGGKEETVSTFERVLSMEPGHVGAIAGMMSLHDADHDVAKAQTASNKLIERLSSRGDSQDPKQEKGSYSGSISNQIDLFGQESGDAASVVSGAWCRLARYKEGQGRVNDAIHSYVESLRTDPRNAASLSGYGRLALHTLKDGRTAECLFTELCANHPRYPGAFTGLGLSLQIQDLHKDAEKAFKRAVQTDPGDVAALTSYASVLQAQRSDLGGAELLYKAALRLDPGHPAACSNYGMLLEELRGDYYQAEKLYRTAIDTAPDDPVTLCHLAMLLQDAKKDITGAEELFKRALQAAPGDAAALSNMATFQYSARGDADYAEKLFRKAVAIDPADVGTLINYGSLLEEARKDRHSAQKIFDIAMSIDPVTAKRYMEQQAGDQYREKRIEQVGDE